MTGQEDKPSRERESHSGVPDDIPISRNYGASFTGTPLGKRRAPELRLRDMRGAQDILRSPPRLTVVQHTHTLRESFVNRVLLARHQLINAGHDHHVRAASDTVSTPVGTPIALTYPCIRSWSCGATITPHYAPRCRSLRLSASRAYFNGTLRRLCLPLAAPQVHRERTLQIRRASPEMPRVSPLGRTASATPRPASSRVMA